MIHMVRPLLVTLMFSLIFFCVNLKADAIDNYTISPPLQEIDLNRETSGYFDLENHSEEDNIIKIAVEYFAPEKQNGVHIDSSVAELEDISRMVIVSPKTVRLRPGTKRRVRYSIRNIERLIKKGEYRCKLVFTPVIKNEIEKKQSSEGVQMNIKWVLQLRVPIYATYGLRDESRLEVTAEKSERDGKHYIDLQMVNPTVWRYPAEFIAYDKNGNLGSKRRVIFRQTRNSVSIELERKPEGVVLVKWNSFLGDDVPGEAGQLSINEP